MAKDKTFKPQDLDKLSAQNTTFFGASYRTKKYDRKKLTKRLILAVIALIIVALLITWLISYILLNGGSFTVKVDNGQLADDVLVIGRAPDLSDSSDMISTPAKQDMDFTSYRLLPAYASHLVDDDPLYIHSRFYLKNDSENAVLNYRYTIELSGATNGIEKAARIMVIRSDADGNEQARKIYAMPRDDGSNERISYVYDENDVLIENKFTAEATPFVSEAIAVNEEIKELEPGTVQRYDVVIWLEGTDPEGNDAIANSRVKYLMTITARTA